MLGQHTRVRTRTLACIAHLFTASQNARFLGLLGSKVESGQFGLHGANRSQASAFKAEVTDFYGTIRERGLYLLRHFGG